ncbi:MAG TPA: hypothetical protein VN229_10630 [Terriglobales bacterium]|nr:hypothetical protein [Terriglobales bacterium]
MIDFLKSLNTLLDQPLHKPAAANDASSVTLHRQMQINCGAEAADTAMAVPAPVELPRARKRA